MKLILYKINAFWKKICNFKFDKKLKFIVAGISGGFVVLLLIGLRLAFNGKEEVTYRETEVLKGNLTVGITESGNVTIGTSVQSFDLDISEYTSDSSFSFGENIGEGMMQMFQNGAPLSTSSTGRTLDIEEVYVTAGQEIGTGTPLLKLSAESVNSIRQELTEDESDAQITYEQAKANENQVNLKAKADADADQAYGAYAEAEYTKTVNAWKESVVELEEELVQEKEKAEEKTAELAEMKELLSKQKEVLENAEYARDSTSREEALYWWITAVNTVSDTKELIETLEEEIEAAEEELEQSNKNITSLNIELALANKELLAGEIEAASTKELRKYRYKNADEIFDVTVSQSGFELQNAKEEYEEAKEKLEEFDSIIQESTIVSAYSGIITDVAVTKGDTLKQDSTIITLNDYAEAAITVTVDEEDMEAAQIGNTVNILFSAYPEQALIGEVTEIGDAEMNSNTNTITYSVTVTITEGSEKLYEGMSAEVTFITDQIEEVLYVSNRAVIKEEEKSYVKVKNEDGKIIIKEISAGFSDGMNVEIKEGLAEGDIVLIER